MMKRNYTNIILASSLILMGAVVRILNREMELYNLAPVAAIALFGGAVIKDKRFAYILPLLAMFLSDLYFEFFASTAGFKGFYGSEQWFVYGAMLLVTLMGTKMGSIKPLKIFGLSVAGSVVFFLLSNLGSYASGMYGYGMQNFIHTYEMAIPFFRNTLVSDLVGNGILFGSYFLLQGAVNSKFQRA